jgi:hypothetical protein
VILTPILEAKGQHLDEEPRRDQRAWIDGAEPVVLQAMLDRTAVVRSLPDTGEGRRLVALARVWVEAETLDWLPMGLQSAASRSRARGRAKALENRKPRSIHCSVCAKERSGGDLAKYPGSICGPCRNARDRKRRLEVA